MRKFNQLTRTVSRTGVLITDKYAKYIDVCIFCLLCLTICPCMWKKEKQIDDRLSADKQVELSSIDRLSQLDSATFAHNS